MTMPPRPIDNGGVADIAGSVFRSVAGVVNGLVHGSGRSDEPFVHAADTQGEINAVAAHGRDDGGMGHAVSGLCGRLASRDGEGQEGVVIAADELGHGIDRFLALVAVQEKREQLAQEQERAGGAAGMDFITHEEMILKMSMPSFLERTARPRTGPSTSRIQRRRSMVP